MCDDEASYFFNGGVNDAMVGIDNILLLLVAGFSVAGIAIVSQEHRVLSVVFFGRRSQYVRPGVTVFVRQKACSPAVLLGWRAYDVAVRLHRWFCFLFRPTTLKEKIFLISHA